MAKEVTNIQQQPRLPGLQPDADTFDLAMRFYPNLWRDESGVVTLPKLPTAAECQQMENRLRELRREFQMVKYASADGDRAMRALGKLFSGYPSLRNANAGDMCASYLDGLCDLPAFCIELAIEDIRHARIPDLDPDWPPTTPRIHKIAEAHRDRLYEREVLPIERVLDAKLAAPADPEMQKSVSELLTGLASDLRNNDEVLIEEEQRRIVRLDEQKAWERKRWDQSKIPIPGTPEGERMLKAQRAAKKRR